MKDSFARYRILGWHPPPPFCTLKTPSYSFLAFMIYNEKSADYLIKDIFYVMSCFYLVTFKILSLSLAFDNVLYCVLMWISLHLLFLGFIKFFECVDLSFSSNLRLLIFFSPNILSFTLFLLFPVIYIMSVLVYLLDNVSHIYKTLHLFLFSFLSSLILDNFN